MKDHQNYSLNTLASSATITLVGYLLKKKLVSKEQEADNTKPRKATSIEQKNQPEELAQLERPPSVCIE